MDDLLKNGVSGNGPPCQDAKTLCEMLLDFATRWVCACVYVPERIYVHERQKLGRIV
jgi:hypothetical protein